MPRLTAVHNCTLPRLTLAPTIPCPDLAPPSVRIAYWARLAVPGAAIFGAAWLMVSVVDGLSFLFGPLARRQPCHIHHDRYALGLLVMVLAPRPLNDTINTRMFFISVD